LPGGINQQQQQQHGSFGCRLAAWQPGSM
jgi:hypothetical protein